ncbi:uncharacterized protein [Elaeis guineensis]|uniref:Oxidation resistance protein 1 n=1 Tax=Elaeis guineensis var. tenera TaxID=51953 RepID=A0A6I9S5G6_ELAGV|nr:oxidation resistance protein 1 [Elaeis guineensis]
MGYMPSLRSKAVHLVSDLTTVILNPISDKPSKPPVDGQGVKTTEKEVSEEDSGDPDGPDTSSFTAFLISLLSPSDSGSHPVEDLNEHHAEMVDTALASEIMENSGKKSLLSRGKQSLGRAIHKAARLSGLRQSSEPKTKVVNESKLVEHEMKPVKVPQEVASQFSLPDMSEPSLLLSEDLRNALYAALPALVQGRNWLLLYSTWRHGISLSTLYRRSMLCPGYSLLVVGDQKGAVFGGLVEAPLCPTNRKKYQGTNRSFVFTNLLSHAVIYRPTGANHYFTLCSTDSLALGGGGHFALYLDGDLLNGSSSTSETFGNSCLAHSEDFEVKEVELWGFVYASKYDEMVTLCRTEKPGICRW